MQSRRCVVVGAGGIFRAWSGPLDEEPVEVAAIVDLDIERARARVEAHAPDAEASDDLPAALKAHEPDFVVDLTVPDAHCEVTITALEHGCHVIGEKPMAANMDQARRMVRAAEAAGKIYAVSQNRRWNPLHDRLQRTVAAGEVGPLTTANCDFYLGAHFGGFRAEMPSPLILDMAIHHFDLVRFFTGKDATAVYAHEFNPAGSWYNGDVAASCIFEMTDGVVFTYRGSWCAEGCETSWNGDWRLIGRQGTLIYERDGEPHGQVVAGDEGFRRPLRDAEIADPQIDRQGQGGALREFLAALDGGPTPQTECHDNIKSLAMVHAAMESARKGERVEVTTL